MGSSWWSCSTAYHGDLREALSAARAAEFERWKDELQFILDHHLTTYRQFGGPHPGVIGTRYEFSEQDLERWLSQPQPQSMEDLIKIVGEQGTHSVIDVDNISPTPGYRLASPLPTERIVELFGTAQPDRSAVEANLEKLPDDDSYCNYVVTYSGNEPQDVYFVGITGD